MNAPTLYFLTVTERWSSGPENRSYEIWEQHMCQEKGCFKTQPEFVDLAFSKSRVKEIIADWKLNPPLNGKLEDVEWESIGGVEQVEDVKTIDARGVYYNMEEMLMAICELSGFKPYEVLNDKGEFAGYTFEVVE